MAQFSPAPRTKIGAVGFRPHPIPLHFTLWIDTLNRGARHYGHSELPQRPQLTLDSSEYPVSPLGGQRFNESTERTLRFLRRALVVSIGKRHKRLWRHQNSVENALVHIRNLASVPFRNRT